MSKAIAAIVTAASLAGATDGQQAGPLRVGSTIEAVRIVAATALPPNKDGGRIDEYCRDLSPRFDIKPKTVGGRLARRRGWIVTSETKLGNYDAVTIVVALDAATSGTCVHRDGNLAIFDGQRLIAIAYEPPPRRNSDPNYVPSEDSLGSAEQIDQRRVRLRWGLPGAPIADVVLRDGVRVEHTAREDPVCGGAASVPNIFEQDIRKARRKLLAFGWRPRRPTDGLRGGLEDGLRKQGVIETEVCSGTGYGYCVFNYANSRGIKLVVTSAGDEPNVIDYGVHCGPNRR